MDPSTAANRPDTPSTYSGTHSALHVAQELSSDGQFAAREEARLHDGGPPQPRHDYNPSRPTSILDGPDYMNGATDCHTHTASTTPNKTDPVIRTTDATGSAGKVSGRDRAQALALPDWKAWTRRRRASGPLSAPNGNHDRKACAREYNRIAIKVGFTNASTSTSTGVRMCHLETLILTGVSFIIK
jgi:hypothetical protein